MSALAGGLTQVAKRKSLRARVREMLRGISLEDQEYDVELLLPAEHVRVLEERMAATSNSDLIDLYMSAMKTYFILLDRYHAGSRFFERLPNGSLVELPLEVVLRPKSKRVSATIVPLNR